MRGCIKAWLCFLHWSIKEGIFGTRSVGPIQKEVQHGKPTPFKNLCLEWKGLERISTQIRTGNLWTSGEGKKKKSLPKKSEILSNRQNEEKARDMIKTANMFPVSNSKLKGKTKPIQFWSRRSRVWYDFKQLMEGKERGSIYLMSRNFSFEQLRELDFGFGFVEKEIFA